MAYKCVICGYVYDPEKGDPDSNIAPGTKFEDLPSDWHCPICNATKEYAFVDADDKTARVPCQFQPRQ